VKATISAIVLAAGTASRMGKPKQLLKVGTTTLLGAVLDKVTGSNADEVILVLGSSASRIIRKTAARRSKVVLNKDFLKGMSTSLKAGLGALSPESDAVLVVLADQPLLSENTLNSMIQSYNATRSPIIAPKYHGKRGNPILFDRSLFPELLALTGDRGAKEVVERHPDLLLEVPVEDEGVVLDIDTREDYNKVRGKLARSRKV
jgi:molybdenum cofactor cytidylyltransferase